MALEALAKKQGCLRSGYDSVCKDTFLKGFGCLKSRGMQRATASLSCWVTACIFVTALVVESGRRTGGKQLKRLSLHDQGG
jgi:hypothetical protein